MKAFILLPPGLDEYTCTHFNDFGTPNASTNTVQRGREKKRKEKSDRSFSC